MTQQVFTDIDPNVTSGTDLATILNNFKASLLTQHSGTTAPTYAQVGTAWFDSSVANILTFKMYDGSQWVTQFSMDLVGHTLSFGGNNPTASFSAERTDTSADMYEMYRNTVAPTHGAVIYSQKNDAGTKKTFGKMKINAENVTAGSEEASFLFEALVADAMTTLFSVGNSSLFFEALKGTGDRVLKVDANGVVTAQQDQADYNLFQNGVADSGDLAEYTANAPLTLVKSASATEILEGTNVFKAVSSAGSETFESEVITIKNAHIDSPMIIGIQYTAGADWTVNVIDNAVATIKTFTLEAYTQTANEGRLHKAFVVIFDKLEVYSWVAKDEPIYFNESILNNQTDTNLFTLTSRKNAVYKVEGQVIRETDTKLADGIYSCYISNNGTVFRVGKEDVYDHESDLIETDLNMNGNILRYSSNDLTGTNYTGKFIGTITRVL